MVLYESAFFTPQEEGPFSCVLASLCGHQFPSFQRIVFILLVFASIKGKVTVSKGPFYKNTGTYVYTDTDKSVKCAQLDLRKGLFKAKHSQSNKYKLILTKKGAGAWSQ